MWGTGLEKEKNTKDNPTKQDKPQRNTTLIQQNTFVASNATTFVSAEIRNQVKAITALTWGHNDKRLFVAAGSHIHVAWVTRKIATLQLMCRRTVQVPRRLTKIDDELNSLCVVVMIIL